MFENFIFKGSIFSKNCKNIFFLVFYNRIDKIKEFSISFDHRKENRQNSRLDDVDEKKRIGDTNGRSHMINEQNRFQIQRNYGF